MKKHLSIIGAGKLGLCLALNLEKANYKVICVDKNVQYIKSLKNKSFCSAEPQVNTLLKKSNIVFSSDLKDAIKNDIIFIVVDTPSTHDWRYDHKNIDSIASKLISLGIQKTRKDLIINCTTFPGYCESLQKKLKKYNFFVSYNPEFIAQGTIINDQCNPDLVLIGSNNKYSQDLLQLIYKNFCKSVPCFHKMTLTEAELTKLSINCYLTTKISFANMVGDIAINLNCNPDKILSAVGSDSRIGKKYLSYGFGFGGPCFPRDNRALAKIANECGIQAIISKATDDMNAAHLENQFKAFIRTNPKKHKIITINNVAYKPGSILLEESQKLKFAYKLSDAGYHVVISDNKDVIKQLKQVYGSRFKYKILK